MSKVIEVREESVVFDDGYELSSNHDQDCCERHWLSFNNMSLEDFDGLEFDLSGDSFFERVPYFGIRLIPTNGHPVGVPGYGSNNGYYSSQLDLVLSKKGKATRYFDISDCQEIDG